MMLFWENFIPFMNLKNTCQRSEIEQRNAVFMNSQPDVVRAGRESFQLKNSTRQFHVISNRQTIVYNLLCIRLKTLFSCKLKRYLWRDQLRTKEAPFSCNWQVDTDAIQRAFASQIGPLLCKALLDRSESSETYECWGLNRYMANDWKFNRFKTSWKWKKMFKIFNV